MLIREERGEHRILYSRVGRVVSVTFLKDKKKEFICSLIFGDSRGMSTDESSWSFKVEKDF